MVVVVVHANLPNVPEAPNDVKETMSNHARTGFGQFLIRHARMAVVTAHANLLNAQRVHFAAAETMWKPAEMVYGQKIRVHASMVAILHPGAANLLNAVRPIAHFAKVNTSFHATADTGKSRIRHVNSVAQMVCAMHSNVATRKAHIALATMSSTVKTI